MTESKNAEKYILFGVGAVIVSALIIRLFFTVSLYDEVYNIHVSYMTAVMGQRHLVENTAIFWGDVFNLPFVWLYYQITGGMDGIVLFIRFVYLGFNLILSLVFRYVFSPYIGKRYSTIFALILITYAPFSVYSVWYDSVALFFMLMGGLFFVGAILDQEREHKIMLYLGGICHGCMVYAYPLSIGVVALILALSIGCIIKKHEKVGKILPYILGGATVILIFCIYCTYMGWGNIYIFREGAIGGALSGRALHEFIPPETNAVQSSAAVSEPVDSAVSSGEITSYNGTVKQIVDDVKYILYRIYQLGLKSIGQQLRSLPFTILLLVQWAFGLKKKGKIRFWLLPEIILTAFICHTGQGQWATQTTYAYYACWSPLLYFYLEEEDRQKGKLLMLFLWAPSLIAYFAVGFTAVHTEKASMGLYTGAICTLIFMVLILSKTIFDKYDMGNMVLFLVAITNVALLYLNVYEGDEISQCSYRMDDGIYKGIWTEQDKEVYYSAEMKIKELNLPKGTTICLLSEPYNYTPLLMWGEFSQAGGDIQYTEEWFAQGAKVEEVFEGQQWADLVAIDKETYEEYPMTRDEIMERYYDLVVSEGDMLIFRKR